MIRKAKRKLLSSEKPDGIVRKRTRKPFKTQEPKVAPQPLVVEEAKKSKEEDLYENKIREEAKDLGIGNYWNKKISTLEQEIEELKSIEGKEEEVIEQIEESLTEESTEEDDVKDSFKRIEDFEAEGHI
jgi:hypothetical protein